MKHILILFALSIGDITGLFCADQDNRANGELVKDLMYSWLQSHGHNNVIRDDKGIGIEGNPVRFVTSVYGTEKNNDGTWTAEIQIDAKLPDGRTITEFPAGNGKTTDAAIGDAVVSYTLATSHVLYKALINSGDTHLTEKEVKIDGNVRKLIHGGIFTRSSDKDGTKDFGGIELHIINEIGKLKLDEKMHWIKVIVLKKDSVIQQCVVTVDNEDDHGMNKAIAIGPWPDAKGFYMAKMFIVIK